MNNLNRIRLVLLAGLLAPGFAWSQIVYAPVAASPASPAVAVPTMTTAALLLMIVLLLVAAKRMGFDRRGALGKIVGVLAVCAVASGTVSVKMVSDAYAGGGGGTNFGSFDAAGGGSVPLNNNVLNVFENKTGVDQRIESITLGSCPNPDKGLIDGVSRCEVDDVISTDENGLCYTDCRSG
ncbi:midcut-by-XrtH protein [Parahaliea aestuarii]|uniref:Midcut-by-XrtH protein n=1 Tax=Parahaliea aestuarii TaxID=1852021 RepID=A0A5C8ZLL4_9GAMM|nr:midcut-by-XrtH protein [Parahaliea aestuarii]TXS89348.1 midcut-by-XrtH protein [Parahaliea aestuarii]